MSKEEFARACVFLLIFALLASILISAILHARIPEPDSRWADRPIWITPKK